MRWTLPNTLTLLRLFAAPLVPMVFLILARPYADFVALALFVSAAITDWFDGHLARSWNQISRFGTAMDPIADKAMVVIALVVIGGYSGMDPWLIVPIAVILFREVFVSGLREFLGAEASRLKVTSLAKWKTTAQMIAITVLLLHGGLAFRSGQEVSAMTQTIGVVGIGLIWLAGLLTAITGWDYFSKARPFLRDHP